MADYQNKKIGGSTNKAPSKSKGTKVKILKGVTRLGLGYHIGDEAVIFNKTLADKLIKEGYAE